MELIIKGGEHKIRRLAKEIKLRVKRDGLEMSNSNEAQEVEELEPTLNAKDTIALIVKAEDLEGLKQFEGDERVTVQRALESKKEELTQ